MKRPAIFFDRDNTLIVGNEYLGDPAKVQLVTGAAAAVARARRLGYATVIVSNQSGVARGLFDETAVHAVNQRLDQLLLADDPAAVIDRHEFCPFHPDATVEKYKQESDLRKPAPGMLLKAADKLALDLSRSWLVGDAARDIEAGRNAGCRTILFTDPDLPPSPAAAANASIPADYTASTLADAIDFIEQCPEPPIMRITPAAEPSRTIDPTASDAAIADALSCTAASTARRPANDASPAEPLTVETPPTDATETHQSATSPPPPAPAGPRRAPAAASAPSHFAKGEPLQAAPFQPAPHSSATSPRPAQANTAPPPQIRSGDSARPAGTVSGANLTRVESLLDQMLSELRRRDLPEDEFSVSKLLAGVVQVIAIAVAFLAYLYRNEPAETFIGILLFANFLQVMTIALLIMGKQR